MLGVTVGTLGITLNLVFYKLLGKTTSKGTEDDDLSIDVLVTDFIELVQSVFKDPATAPTFLVIIPTNPCESCIDLMFLVSSLATAWVAQLLYGVVRGY
jgi:hypothetical protein